MGKIESRLIFLFPALLGFWVFFGCDNPAQIEVIHTFDNITVSVKDTILDSVYFPENDQTYYNKKAYIVQITPNEPSWNPNSGEPVIYNIYKRYQEGETVRYNRASRVFAGGGGETPGDTVCYQEKSGGIDTMVYQQPVRDIIITGTEEKTPFQITVGAMDELSRLGAHLYGGGQEGERVIYARGLGGGVTRSFSINNGDLYTAGNIVTVRARFDAAALSELYYVRFSSIKIMPIKDILAIDSLLKAAGPLDTQFVRINDSFRVKLADSAIYDNQSIDVGKFGGKTVIPGSALYPFFDDTTYGGEPGWVNAVKTDTLPLGAGKKWLFLDSPRWSSAMSDDIDIAPFGGEIALDLTSERVLINDYAKAACLVADEIPFIFRTFGDTTFDRVISVWMATMNLGPENVILDNLGNFSDAYVRPKHNAVGYAENWPDAIIEVPPEDFSLGANTTLKGDLSPDYDTGYRVSPLVHMFPQNVGMGKQYETPQPKRPNNKYLHQMVTRGSILGYSEKSLNDFKGQDSILTFGEQGLDKIPATGWFVPPPLNSVTDLGGFSIPKVLAYFNLTSLPALQLSKDVYGNKYFSVYAAFIYTGEKYVDHGDPTRFPLTLYRNPIRAIPSHITHCNNGAKEFILIALARGKYFKEPRVFISSFTSPYKYTWDKIAPHAAWAESYITTSPAYAPMYYASPISPDQSRITDLSLTPIPLVFDVSLSVKNPRASKECAVRDIGFGRIVSVRLCFNYASDFIFADPVTGFRHYAKENIVMAELSEKDLAAQQKTTVSGKSSYSLSDIKFKNINAVLWKKGIWDMWIETADDLGNAGIAPFNGDPDITQGKVSVRQIEIK